MADHLPEEAAEALLELATGGQPKLPITPVQTESPFEHPDARRRFRTLNDADELQRALDFPWDKWTIFLHPAQREWVEKDFNGPARVSGSAGTGKTIVALHRAVYLARTFRESRVLLTTFSAALANALRTRLRRLIGSQPRLGERIDVEAMDAIGMRLYERAFGKAKVVSDTDVAALLASAASRHSGHGFSAAFLHSEWNNVVDAWQLKSWEAYRDVQRLGRRTRLPESRRKVLWEIFADVLAEMKADGKTTVAGMFGRVAEELAKRQQPPVDFAVVDEAQDVSVAQLQFLAALAGARRNGLFFAGDLGQRIFQQPFSWKSQGVDVRGRSRTLHVNYRTSHQIRTHADRLLDPEVADVDGNVETRLGTVSAFNGPEPEIRMFDDPATESVAAGAWLAARGRDGMLPAEIAVFVRSPAQLERAKAAVESAGMAGQVLDQRLRIEPGKVAISTMHLAKELEFRAVAVMACDDEVIPSQERIDAIADNADLEEVYNTERHLLYVACTRARDRLWVSGVEPASEFLTDLTRSASATW